MKGQQTMTNPNTASGMEKNPHILVADDHEANHKIAQLILQRAGYHVDVVEDGQQAVEAYQQNHYDLILMDVQMPLMDGLEATEEIRKWEKKLKAKKVLKAQGSKPKEKDPAHLSALSLQLFSRAQLSPMQDEIGDESDPNSAFRIPTSDFKTVPIIAMTGSAALGKFDEKRYPGMNDYIGKPLQRDDLLSVVLKWLRPESNTPTNENPAVKTRATDKRSEENQFPIDLDRAIHEFMGQKEILIGVLQKFVTRAGSQVDTIRQAVKGVDYGTIGAEAHAIKGAAANLTADKLAGLASDLEQAAVKQQPGLAGELAHKLEQEFNCLERYIQLTLS